MSDKDRIITGYKEYTVNELADMFWGVYAKPHKLLTLNYDETFELLDFLYTIDCIHDNSFNADKNDKEDVELLNIAKEISDHENEHNVSILHPIIRVLTQYIYKNFDIKLSEDTQKIYERGVTEDNNKPDSKANKKLYARHIGLIYHYKNISLPSHGSIDGNKKLENELKHINNQYKDYLKNPLNSIQSFSDRYKRYEGKHNRIGHDKKRRLNHIKKDIELIIELKLIEGEALKTAKQELSKIEEKLSTFY
jgi:hypothetical protein